MMDITTRAARAAKKRNNKTRRALPLLDAQNAIPADWMTTPEVQLTRIERQLAWNDGYWERFQQAEQQRAADAARLREITREKVTPKAFEALEYEARFTAHLSPVYALDYWRRTLARLDPSYCPHVERKHAWMNLTYDHCPICGIELEIPAVEHPADQQMSFFKGKP